MVSCLFSLVAFIILASSSVDAFKLSEEENAALQKTCGTKMREADSYTRKVLNGTIANAGETPWTVALYIPDHLDHSVYTTGTLVSNRHIISYDRLFLTNTTDGIKLRHNLKAVIEKDMECEGNDYLLPSDLVRSVAVFLDLLSVERQSGHEQLDVKSVRILNGCVKSFQFNRVAVIELKKPVHKGQNARPICFGSDFRIYTGYKFFGYGDNRGAVKDATLRHTKIKEVPCKHPSEDLFCVTAENPLCNGDFGGAAVSKFHGSVRAYGVYVDGPYECNKANRRTVYTFANMTKLAESLCDVTGICAPYLPSQQTTVTTTITPVTSIDHTNTTPNPGSFTTGSGTVTGSDGTCPGNPCNGLCVEEDDDDIHIHIRLGKYKKTRNDKDIEIIRRGPKSFGTKSI